MNIQINMDQGEQVINWIMGLTVINAVIKHYFQINILIIIYNQVSKYLYQMWDISIVSFGLNWLYNRNRFNQINERFDRIEDRLDTLEADTSELKYKMDYVIYNMERIENKMDARFEQMDAKFEQMDARFEQMSAKFDAMMLMLTQMASKQEIST